YGGTTWEWNSLSKREPPVCGVKPSTALVSYALPMLFPPKNHDGRHAGRGQRGVHEALLNCVLDGPRGAGHLLSWGTLPEKDQGSRLGVEGRGLPILGDRCDLERRVVGHSLGGHEAA